MGRVADRHDRHVNLWRGTVRSAGTERCDFAVIGAGPAGVSAAARLARQGADVVLFERSRMPRDKLCAGALPVHAMSHLGFPLPPPLIDAKIHGVRIHAYGAMIEAALQDHFAVLVTRSRFDEFLVEKARECGARTEWNEVASVTVEAGQALLRTAQRSVAAKCAIICEGASRRLSRSLMPAEPRDEQWFCVQAHVPASADRGPGDVPRLLDLYFGIVPFGYGWAFDHGSYWAIGAASMGPRWPRLLATLRQLLAERGLCLSGLKPHGHFIPCAGFGHPIYGERLLVAGDAAGFGDPLHGEGMAHAIRSGQLAAEVAMAAESRKDFSRESLREYAARCWQEFGGDLQWARRLARVIYHWQGPLFKAAARDARILTEYLSVPCGRRTYGGYLRWLLPRLPLLWLCSKGRPA